MCTKEKVKSKPLKEQHFHLIYLNKGTTSNNACLYWSGTLPKRKGERAGGIFFFSYYSLIEVRLEN